MTILAAIAVACRVALIIIAMAMLVSMRAELWAVIRRKSGWKTHLSTFIFTCLVTAGAIISSANIFPDAGWIIPRNLRLVIVDFGLLLFLMATLTGLYRRALRVGPDKARAAILSGLALLTPGIGLVWLLTGVGAHG